MIRETSGESAFVKLWTAQKYFSGTLIIMCTFLAFCGRGEGMERGRVKELIDWDWRFHRGEVENAEKPEFDDSAWRKVDLPHDWSIEGSFDRNIPGESAMDRFLEEYFGSDNPEESWAASLAGYRPGGVGIYRKRFTLPKSARGKRAFIQFDGVYMNTDIWINGRHLGNHPYGYTSFQYELTPFLHYGDGGNVLVVRADVQQPCSRWYSGAGIYRHVWLTITEPIHVAHWGTDVTTPEVTDKEATVQVRTKVANQGDQSANISLETSIVDPTGTTVASITTSTEVGAETTAEFDQSVQIPGPWLWSLESPHLYKAISVVREGKEVLDEYTTSFGIRTFEFTKNHGFFLNGKHVEIRGFNMHHDQGCLGAAAYDRAIERQLEILKGMGCNAIRTAHNPPAPAFLDLCDRMGFLVMDEAFDEWKEGKMRFGYSRFFDEWSEPDLVSMIRRDRNHPSVVLWSIGNEIGEQESEVGYQMAKRLAEICHREDPTRPVTAGCNSLEQALETRFAEPLDVIGINYDIEMHDRLRGDFPLFGSESTVALSTRGEYNLILEDGDLEIKPRIGHVFTSYDIASLGLHETSVSAPSEAVLKAFKDRPWVAGQFVWSGFDYLGEPLPVKWPSRSSYFGVVDLCGFPKDRYYLYRSQWTDKPTLHILPHWNWEEYEGLEIPVWIYTNCDSVELFLDDKSLGTKNLDSAEAYHLEWKVPYKPGTLRAVGKRGGAVACTKELQTAGDPARLVLETDRETIHADGQDLAYVTVRIIDKDGNLCPNANNQIVFR